MKHFTHFCLLSFMICNSVAAQPFGEAAKGYRVVRQDDRNGNTTAILWLFSFGKFQRYTFTLQPD